MRDFTIHIYEQLLQAIQDAGYTFLTFEQYCELRRNNNLPARYVILRHDVDKRPLFSVRTAEAEALADAKASYYFRVGSESNNPDCIKLIAQLGHEIGYHYEDMSLCHGDHAKAYEHFCGINIVTKTCNSLASRTTMSISVKYCISPTPAVAGTATVTACATRCPNNSSVGTMQAGVFTPQAILSGLCKPANCPLVSCSPPIRNDGRTNDYRGLEN